MRLYGYEKGNRSDQGPMTLSEVTLTTSPAELRAIARVLVDIASEMESASFGHVHLTDRVAQLSDSPELVVMRLD